MPETRTAPPSPYPSGPAALAAVAPAGLASPASPAGPRARRLPAGAARAAAPGILLCAAVALAAVLVSTRYPLVSSMLIAIIVGLVLRNAGFVPAIAEAGLKVTGKTVLRAGVVLLGLRLSLPAVLRLGWGAIGVIALTVVAVFCTTLWLGRLLGVPHATTLLTATGTAICGAAAVAGMSAVVRPHGEDDDVEDAAATAIASVTLFGTLAILVLPLLVRTIGLDALHAGVWVGASVHEVGQVVATAGLVSAAVLDVAVVAKLGRVVLLAPLVALVGYLEGRRSAPSGEGADGAARLEGSGAGPRRSAPVVPLFVVGFLVAVVLRSLLDGRVPGAVWGSATTAAGFLLTMAMCAMGAGVNMRRLACSGGRAMLLGACAGIVSAIVSLLGVLALV